MEGSHIDKKHILEIISELNHFRGFGSEFKHQIRIEDSNDFNNRGFINSLKYLHSKGAFQYKITWDFVAYDYINFSHIDFGLLYKEELEIKGVKKNRPIIHQKILEKICRTFGDVETGEGILQMIRSIEIPEWMVYYPKTKWKMLYDILCLLNETIEYKNHKKYFFAIISEILSPFYYLNSPDLNKEMLNLLKIEGFYYENGALSKNDEISDLRDNSTNSFLDGNNLKYNGIEEALGGYELKLCEYFFEEFPQKREETYTNLIKIIYGDGVTIKDQALQSLYKAVNRKAKKIGLSNQLFSSVNGGNIRKNPVSTEKDRENT